MICRGHPLRALPCLALSALLVMHLASPRAASAQSTATWQRRADAALRSFLTHFWDEEQVYLRDRAANPRGISGYWTYAQGFDALLDGYERTRKPEYRELIGRFYEGQDRRRWLVPHYDDQAWMALALMRAFDLTGERRYLERAEALLGDLRLAWDTTCCGDRKGGVWWDRSHSQKATASNAGTALAAARLYQRTRRRADLRFAEQVYRFWRETMVNPATGQVADHIDPKGQVTWWRFTYNEGLMIGAAVELYRITRDPDYLEDAHRFARFMVAQETTPTRFGRVLHDGGNNQCGGDCHQFKGPAYRYLMLLYRLDPTHTEYFDVLRASAQAIWSLARNPETGLFAVSWAGPPMDQASVAQQSAAAMALNLYALHLSGAAQTPPARPTTKSTKESNQRSANSSQQ